MEDPWKEIERRIKNAERAAKIKSDDEMIAFLSTSLGKRATAYGLGFSDTKSLINSGAFTNIQKMRLRYFYQAARILDELDGADMVRTWFFGMNEYFDDKAPLTILRNASIETDAQSVVYAAIRSIFN